MTTQEEALAAKVMFRMKLGRPPWLRGIGIGKRHGEHVIKVNVAEINEEVSALPSEVSGVAIQVEVVGDIEAQYP